MGAGNRIERLSLHYERSVLPLHHPAIKFILFKHHTYFLSKVNNYF